MSDFLLRNCLKLNDEANGAEGVDVLIKNGRIANISSKITPEDNNIKVIDIKENYIFPGIIDCHTHLGILEECTGKIGIDNNETSDPVLPHIRAIDGINPNDISFRDAVCSGITCVMSGPGSNNPVGGLNLVTKTYGNILDTMVVKNPLGLKIALGENPLSIYGVKDKSPVTRMGTAALIRELFMKTQDYIVKKENGTLKERDIKLEAVIPLIKGDLYLRAHAHRADDIITAVRIAEEFNINKLVIEHGTEAHLIKDFIKARQIPIAYGPMLTPRIKMELRKRNYNSVCELFNAGIKIALITDHPYNSIDKLRSIAIMALSEGLSRKDAVKSITIHPAEILGLQERIGKLEVGYDADIAIFKGDPLSIMSRVIMTIVNGELAFNDEGEIKTQ